VILRPAVLAGVRVAATGHVAARMAELGADLSSRPPDVVVFDGAAAFSAGVDGVRAVLDGGWDAIRASLADDQLIVLLAPPPGDAHAEAARAGLENMARTLSIEWARRRVRPVAIHPGAATSPAEVAELAAFLASPAGAYYSGCRFDLGSVSPAHGTSTESSVGESRATTYSAGSASERFWSRWVSRGGT
jgi:NAD(P)-dependent dehydrogenase (short-subunit alcohol dehydrogenase family)